MAYAKFLFGTAAVSLLALAGCSSPVPPPTDLSYSRLLLPDKASTPQFPNEVFALAKNQNQDGGILSCSANLADSKGFKFLSVLRRPDGDSAAVQNRKGIYAKAGHSVGVIPAGEKDPLVAVAGALVTNKEFASEIMGKLRWPLDQCIHIFNRVIAGESTDHRVISGKPKPIYKITPQQKQDDLDTAAQIADSVERELNDAGSAPEIPALKGSSSAPLVPPRS